MRPKQPVTRRELLRRAAGTLAIPAIVPASVIGRPGRQGANDRIRTAVIGPGGMGSNHILPDCAALADVDEGRLAAAARKVTQGVPALYRDFRHVLDRSDIDAVFIATPDHWHALQTVMACQAGKHVYSEKPTARTIQEGRAMVNAARRYNRVVQIGAQGRSHKNAWHACRFVRNGGCGKVSRVTFWHPDNPTTDQLATPQRVPNGLDWNLWVGPARWVDYSPVFHPGSFRWFMDLGGGQIRDRGNHGMNMVFWLMKMDDYQGRVTVEAKGEPQVSGCYDVPLRFEVRWEFENPAWTLEWIQPGEVKLGGLWGATYQGDRDSLVLIKGDGNSETEEKAKRFELPSGGEEVYLHPTSDGGNSTPPHQRNFLDCIRSGARPATDVEVGHKTVTMCILANLSWKLGRKLVYDYGSETFPGDDQASRLISEPMRAPWRL